MDVAVRSTGRIWRANYRANYEDDEFVALVAQLKSMQPDAVRLKSTGGLETPLVAVLAAAVPPPAAVNLRQAHDFTKVTGP